MIHTLEYWKKAKNYLAHEKGYKIDPEGFSIKWLYMRYREEYFLEFSKVFELYLESPDNELIADKLISEIADLSNILDYISSKIVMKYPDKYNEEVKG